jgi:PAS domain S-box-containing protein
MSPLNKFLRESQKSDLELFKLSPQPMWIYDVSSLRFLDVNDAAIVHYGYSREEFLNMTIREIRPMEDLAILESALEVVFKDRPTLTSNIYRHQKKNGEIIDVQIQSNLLDYQDITVELILVNDITTILKTEKELRASREELLQSERRFKALIQEGSDLTAILDVDSIYRFASENFKAILNINPEQLLGRNALEFVHPEDKKRIQQILTAIKKRKRINIAPFRFKYGTENWRWITTTATNLLDDPAVAGIVTTSKDVTEAIRKNNELRLSNERYKLVLKASDEAICDWDIENDNVTWGSGFHDIFGYDLTVYNNNLWSENIHPDDQSRVLQEVNNAIEDPDMEIYYSEYRFLKANREAIHIQHRGIFLRNEAGRAIRSVDTLRDITAHKERLEHIEKQNQQLKQIAWTQSHNVRGPLARIQALADLLKDENSLAPGQKELLDYLSISVAELDEAIKDIIKKTE